LKFNDAAATKLERPNDCLHRRLRDSTTLPPPNNSRHCHRRDSTTPPPPNSKDPTTVAIVEVEV